jgi:hypothetical protein
MTDRLERLTILKQNYDNRYGEYKYYGGQFFVFKKGKKAIKTLIVREDRTPIHLERPFLYINSRPVYTGDSKRELIESKKDFLREVKWYKKTFHEIPFINIPKEKYSYCKDPLGSQNQTVKITTEWIPNIQGDIFRIDSQQLFRYLQTDEEFKESLICLLNKFLELSEQDIYPDFLGVDNIAIYENTLGNPRIALIDPHIIWIKKYSSEDVTNRLNTAIERMRIFLSDPNELINIKAMKELGTIDPQ